jgi:hypothetical protein
MSIEMLTHAKARSREEEGSKRIHHKRHRGHERTAEEKVTKNSGQVIKQEREFN